MTTKKSATLVSVLISAFNVEKYIEESINSILDQTHPNLEILIVDDGSSDNTLKLIKRFKDFRVISYTQNNKGKAATLNDLIDVANGEYILIHDADDISKPNRVAVLLDILQKNNSIDMVLSSYSLIINEKEIAPKLLSLNIEQCREKIKLFQIPSHDATLMVRTSIARKHKYDATLFLAQGIDFIMRVGEHSNIVVSEKVLYSYRIHPFSTTKKRNSEKIDFLLHCHNKARIRRNLQPITTAIFLEQSGKSLQYKDNNLAGHFTESVYILIQKNQRIKALKVAIFSLKYIGLGIRYAKPIIYSLAPKFIGNLGRKIFGKTLVPK